MKLSTKGRSGLRAVLDLASRPQNEPASIASIAARQHLSECYLEQLIAKLKKAGIVASSRGSNGGYFLAKPDTEITVGEVLRVLEGDLVVTDCFQESENCELFDSCSTKYVWKRINESISTAVDTLTLHEVVSNSCVCGNGDKQR